MNITVESLLSEDELKLYTEYKQFILDAESRRVRGYLTGEDKQTLADYTEKLAPVLLIEELVNKYSPVLALVDIGLTAANKIIDTADVSKYIELYAKLYRIANADLTHQLKAEATRKKYLAYVEVGFTQDEALKLCIADASRPITYPSVSKS